MKRKASIYIKDMIDAIGKLKSSLIKIYNLLLEEER